MLFWDAGQRHAQLVKSTTYPNQTVAYEITADGVRGVPRKRPRPPDQ